jgi:hypothetical protein
VKARSSRTRVLFLDAEDGWSLFLEPLGSDGSDIRINPCMRAEILQSALSIVEAPAVS